jgi:hypothetical protein
MLNPKTEALPLQTTASSRSSIQPRREKNTVQENQDRQHTRQNRIERIAQHKHQDTCSQLQQNDTKTAAPALMQTQLKTGQLNL